MKALCALFALTLFCSCSLAAETADEATQKDLRDKATAFIEHLEKGEYQKATELFDDKVKGLMPADKLSEAWTGLSAQLGKYVGRKDAAYGVEKGYDKVDILCEFEKSQLKLMLVFDKDKKIGGLWFLPPDKK